MLWIYYNLSVATGNRPRYIKEVGSVCVGVETSCVPSEDDTECRGHLRTAIDIGNPLSFTYLLLHEQKGPDEGAREIQLPLSRLLLLFVMHWLCLVAFFSLNYSDSLTINSVLAAHGLPFLLQFRRRRRPQPNTYKRSHPVDRGG